MIFAFYTFFVAEPAESSDSGVDANSVSSCELSSSRLEMQSDSFNKQQCVDYLRNGEWESLAPVSFSANFFSENLLDSSQKDYLGLGKL